MYNLCIKLYVFMSIEIINQKITISDQLTLLPVEPKSPALEGIADILNSSYKGLQKEVSSRRLFFWTVSRNCKDIGFICLQKHESMADLEERITEKDLAKKLFQRDITLEAAMILDEKYCGQGIGKTIAQALMDRRKEFPYLRNVFMVVNSENQASRNMLEKRKFHFAGSYEAHSFKQKLCCKRGQKFQVYSTENISADNIKGR